MREQLESAFPSPLFLLFSCSWQKQVKEQSTLHSSFSFLFSMLAIFPSLPFLSGSSTDKKKPESVGSRHPSFTLASLLVKGDPKRERKRGKKEGGEVSWTPWPSPAPISLSLSPVRPGRRNNFLITSEVAVPFPIFSPSALSFPRAGKEVEWESKKVVLLSLSISETITINFRHSSRRRREIR